ncbi:uncharacterized protein LOC119252974 isoform X1 [Talpa occidentalis]|uniref:uncharacterized protein LOC119252974 isoform X1 n=1 Tax=Talpa occidentalis TaxID=50954 RepID=UPI0023FA10D2|nr:uncharacterized protein LOC119252974 isoform X1 [Talpa occidentalis]
MGAPRLNSLGVNIAVTPKTQPWCEAEVQVHGERCFTYNCQSREVTPVCVPGKKVEAALKEDLRGNLKDLAEKFNEKLLDIEPKDSRGSGHDGDSGGSQWAQPRILAACHQWTHLPAFGLGDRQLDSGSSWRQVDAGDVEGGQRHECHSLEDVPGRLEDMAAGGCSALGDAGDPRPFSHCSPSQHLFSSSRLVCIWKVFRSTSAPAPERHLSPSSRPCSSVPAGETAPLSTAPGRSATTSVMQGPWFIFGIILACAIPPGIIGFIIWKKCCKECPKVRISGHFPFLATSPSPAACPDPQSFSPATTLYTC